MSSDEQAVAVGRLIMQRSEIRKRRALLENELRNAGRSLADIGGNLKHLGGCGEIKHILPLIDGAPEICGLDRVRAMLTELVEVRDMASQLDKSCEEAGIA